MSNNNAIMNSSSVSVGNKSLVEKNLEEGKVIKLAPEVNYEDVEENALNNFDEVVYEDFEEKFEAADDLLEDIEEQDVIQNNFVESIMKYQSYIKPIELAKENGDNENYSIFKERQDEAFEEVFKHYKPILVRLGSRRNDEDLTAELNAVLIKAMETFDNTCGAKFNTYFWKCARNHMGTLSIRKNAKKRTAEHGIVSIQQTMVAKSSKDSEVELVNFIEDESLIANYEERIFRLTLSEKIYPYLKDDEITAIEMLLDGYTLEEIGHQLDNITAPAVHIKLKRLADKKTVGKQLKQIFEKYC
jgi:RNA polymerase sigma factor (sigma-70 family)